MLNAAQKFISTFQWLLLCPDIRFLAAESCLCQVIFATFIGNILTIVFLLEQFTKPCNRLDSELEKLMMANNIVCIYVFLFYFRYGTASECVRFCYFT